MTDGQNVKNFHT